MAVVTSGAHLLKLLKQHGTPEENLDIGRRVLLDAKLEGRFATSADVLDALIERFTEQHGTVAKAIELVETGDYVSKRYSPTSATEDEIYAAEQEAMKAVADEKKLGKK